jgi:hypothetical protein
MTEVTETKPAPTLTEGRIVRYVLSEYDVKQINEARAKDASRVGNPVYAGAAFPAICVRVFEKSDNPAANLQVFLDGNDSLWVTSRKRGNNYLDLGTWLWPERT